MDLVTSPELISIARESIPQGSRISITGGTGFVGSHLAQTLCDAGYQVTIQGRSKFRVRSSGHFVACDLANDELNDLIKDHEIVFHVAAKTSPWGSLAEHNRINRDGTKKLVEACLQQGIQRLVHVSSTAMFFTFQDGSIDDETPFPDEFCCPYAESKAAAEVVVRDAIHHHSLNAYIVRARAVFGPGDTTLLPRLISAAEAGRLRQIGSGKNSCDLTYIDNLIAGLLLAANPERPKGHCTITNHQPVNLWDLLHRVLRELVPQYQSARRIPYWLADKIAWAVEWKHRLTRSRGEPVLTRYSVGLLAKEQRITSAAATNDLDYRPIVTVDEGIRRTLQSLNPSQEIPRGGTPVSIQYFSTGFLKHRRSLVERGASKTVVRIHGSIALISHPKHGHILFDTGYSPRFMEATNRFPYRIYRWTTKPDINPQWAAAAWLKRMGIASEDVKLVLLSHLHGDHTCGLDQFPEAEFLTTERCWDDIRGRRGLAALKRAFLPGLLPDGFPSRLHTLRDFSDEGVGPFRHCIDLFRDGSVRLIDLSGHAEGQMGAIVSGPHGQPILLAADAFWTRREAEEELKPTWPFRMVAANNRDSARTRAKVTELLRANPDLQVVCCHCPDFAEEQGFDRKLAEALQVSE